MFKKEIPIFEAVSVIVGTVIGAGVLGVPFVFSQDNFWTSSVILILVSLGVLLTKLFLGEVTLRTVGNHQLSGYAGKYLGSWARWLQAGAIAFMIYGALLAYTVGEGEILATLFGGSPTMWGLVFYAIFTLLIFKGLSLIKKVEFILILTIFVVVIALAFISSTHFDISYISGWGIIESWQAYGVILFACGGIMSIPLVHEILKSAGDDNKMHKVILTGMAIPVVLYFIFALVTVGVTGPDTTQIATVGLGLSLGKTVLILGSAFAFFAMATSFLSLGLALEEIFQYDFKASPRHSWWMVVVVPLVLYLVSNNDFISILGFVGALATGLIGIIVVFSFWGARRHGKLHPAYKIPSWLAHTGSVYLLMMYTLGILFIFR